MTPTEEETSISPMIIPKFVGRGALVREAAEALSSNTHIFVRGPFGIGKTAFAREVLKSLKAPPITLSFQDASHKMSEDFISQVAEYKRGLKKRHAKATCPGDSSGYKTLRQLKGQLIKNRDVVKYVIIDNVFRASHPKLKFLRFLSDHGYKFIINIESDKNEREIFLLRSLCYPQIQVTLPRLNKKESVSLIEQFFKNNSRRCNDAEVETLATQLKGYPRMIVERMNRE